MKKRDHPLVVLHVAEGINVNQKADAGDDQQHHRAQRIDLERQIHFEGTGIDPGINQVAEEAARRQLPENVNRKNKRSAHCRAGQRAGGFPAQGAAPEKVERRGKQWNQRDPAQQIVVRQGESVRYHFSSCMS